MGPEGASHGLHLKLSIDTVLGVGLGGANVGLGAWGVLGGVSMVVGTEEGGARWAGVERGRGESGK